ncbi:ATP-binding protein [Streptosporangium fragile]
MFLDSAHRSVGQARREVRDRLGPDHPLVEDVLQVVSELVANAVDHADHGLVNDLIGLTVTVTADSVLVEVSDAGSASSSPHIPRDRSLGAEDGRGLLIVDRLSEGRWGTREHGPGLGRTVWCAVPRAVRESPADETLHPLPRAVTSQ